MMLQVLPCAAETPGKMERGSAEIPMELGLLPTLSSKGRGESTWVFHGSTPPTLQSSTASWGPCGVHREGSRHDWPGQHGHSALGKALREQG